METSVNERIMQLVEATHMKDKDFAKAIKIPQSTMSSLKNQVAEPKFGILYSILDSFPDISPDWLILGRGEMQRSKADDSGPQSDTPYIEQVNFLRQQICEKDRQISQLMKMANDAQQLALVLGQKNANA